MEEVTGEQNVVLQIFIRRTAKHAVTFCANPMKGRSTHRDYSVGIFSLIEKTGNG